MFEFVGKKMVDLDTLQRFLDNMRQENESSYVNEDNVITDEDISSIFNDLDKEN